MPKLVRLYITQVLIGFAIAAVFVGALLVFDVAGLWGLVSRDPMGVLAVIVLWISNGIVFSGVQFAIKIMGMAEKDDTPRGGKRDEIPMFAEPIPVRVDAKRR